MTEQPEEDPEIPGEVAPLAIVCGDSALVYKDVTRTRTLINPAVTSWPPRNWNTLTPQTQKMLLEQEASDVLNGTVEGQALVAEMQKAAEDAALNDAAITCNACAPVAGQANVGVCVKGVLRPAPVVLPAPGNTAPPPFNNVTASHVTAGLSVTATYKFQYAVTVTCSKEGCRCTDCGQFHPNPDQ